MSKVYSLFVKPLRGTFDFRVTVEQPVLLLIGYGIIGLGVAHVVSSW